ncbi:protein kinase domain-containing protein [Butyrivibrio sp. TB]|uniref:protein kinase domain-containing protein n=1 Tax=Butyrivibrio sp. TB TaxID=1520809 RepID=UPI0008CD2C1C|nr:protein kinase [Butyrivibrio sp. TB]SEQ33395.1 serine/threonine protein kinase [Butyrivibrio sp. TB]
MIELFLNKKCIYYIDQDEIIGSSGKTYEIENDGRLGAGGNGVVYRCIDSEGSEYAVKILLYFGGKAKKRFLQEISLMKRIHNNHIISYVDEGTAVVSGADGKSNIALFVVMELADGNLVDYLKRNRKIDYSVYAGQFRGLCEGLKEMHQYAIHRDIKPENILIKGDTWILSDFGLCEFLDEKEHIDLTGKQEKIGPMYWISPEAANYNFFNEDRMGTYSDVYQLAMVFAFVLLRRFPGGVFYPDDTLNTTKGIRDLIIRSISNNYNKRPQNGGELLEMYNKATLEAL